jgi:carboxypeptidase Q
MRSLFPRKACVKEILASIAVGILLLGSVQDLPAQAPPPTPEKRIEEIERQLKAIGESLEELRRDLHPAESTQPKDARRADDKAAAPKTTSAATASPPSKEQIADAIGRIRQEGLNRSQVTQTLSYLTDVIGPRLTGSPNLKRANQWTADKLASWGLANAHLEAWGPFGRGWSLKRFSAQIVEPQAIPLAGYPKAWSSGLEQPIEADVIYFEVKTEADLEKYKGKLKGAVVLIDPPREIKAGFEPQAVRRTETDLLRLANSGESQPFRFRRGGNAPPAPPERTGSGPDWYSLPGRTASQFRSWLGRWTSIGAREISANRRLSFLASEGAAVLVSTSNAGDGGTIFVQSASVPGSDGPRAGAGPNAPRRTAWAADAPPMPAQITLAAESYNRLVRMIQQGERLKMAVDLQVQFHTDDMMAYNTVAEIPGGDLKDQIVMLGAHLDSWHSGTGAVDDATGVAAAMEAVRIIKTLNLQPRRTIRIALWSGEEQGLLGSKAYVTRHFGEYVEEKKAADSPAVQDQDGKKSASEAASAGQAQQRKVVRQDEYDKLSVYFNLDEGTGKIRGIFLQGNEAVRPIFRRWFEPFKDLGAETLSLANAAGTDHYSFDAIGLPGFHFIQDPIEYWSRSHHANGDVFERVQADDIKQAATILAAFAYNAAMIDEKLPRKPVK